MEATCRKSPRGKTISEKWAVSESLPRGCAERPFSYSCEQLRALSSDKREGALTHCEEASAPSSVRTSTRSALSGLIMTNRLPL